jgi:hypothetical protein
MLVTLTLQVVPFPGEVQTRSAPSGHSELSFVDTEIGHRPLLPYAWNGRHAAVCQLRGARLAHNHAPTD